MADGRPGLHRFFLKYATRGFVNPAIPVYCILVAFWITAS